MANEAALAGEPLPEEFKLASHEKLMRLEINGWVAIYDRTKGLWVRKQMWKK